MKSKSQIKTLVCCIVIPLAAGALSGLLAGNSREIFASLNQPSFAPPGWVFPVVWTILYILMGIASYLVITSYASGQETDSAVKLYSLQLAVNFFWSIFFFRFGLYFFSFIWLLLLWLLILACISVFYRISKPAAYLLVPYLLWVTFAAYLNSTIVLLN